MSNDRRRLFVTTIYFLEEPVNGSLRRDVATPPTSVPKCTKAISRERQCVFLQSPGTEFYLLLKRREALTFGVL
ncbi:hypothetical protein CC1G_03597 [Coprinopsis cinerea okayama7|uniref:Uncharacterized protein n=1 Tax=Coprinopsis cinerea (strain Okayama-7 / 130 / ATCC MYA-4618 / FGSC 9003) TaxID=240176 RepID=A8NCN9_COPC7|nr:hypothetical protein CC1G_03597 [Coprinopsis cinerea okayama7\|eukprot:XP_001832583.2 hypothetical protein CC1G_03597 [Coprinopsis cinerea okayama7\